MNNTARPGQAQVKQVKPLRTHKRAFVLLFFYIPLVLIPWVMTMILVRRPLTESSWTYPAGFSHKDYKSAHAWARAIPIMNAFAAVLAITVTSAVLAQVAVVVAQRRHVGQQMSVKELFWLADRVWCDWAALPRTMAYGKGSGKWFALLGAVIVLLGAVQYPLFQILTTWEELSVPNCLSTRFIQNSDYGMRRCDLDSFEWKSYTLLGSDLEPAQMAVMPALYVIPRIKSELSTVRSAVQLSNLWQQIDEYGNRHPATLDYIDDSGFVAAFSPDTTTGVLREHIMRMSSSISCTNLTVSAFPPTCSGTNPFQASINYEYNIRNGTLDICAPGDQGKHPWTMSRNRQDLKEELFFRFVEIINSERYGQSREEGVVHCTAQTTRGYFELGNIHNQNTYGSLLDKWPTAGPRKFHDYVRWEYGFGRSSRGYFPSEEDNQQGRAESLPDPLIDDDAPRTYTNITGPLMTSVLTLFGPYSWSHTALNATANKSEETLSTSLTPDQSALLEPLCNLKPFARGSYSVAGSYSRFQCTRSLNGLKRTVHDLLSEWKYEDMTEEKLRIALFLSNRAALTSHADGTVPWHGDIGREIYTAPGFTLIRPRMHLAAQIILSIIVGTHVLALLFLACVLLHYPAWSRTLDALAIARIATSLNPGLLPPLRSTKTSDAEKLNQVEGLIGVRAADEAEVPGPAGGVLGGRQSEREREREPETGIDMEALSRASTVGKGPDEDVLRVHPAGVTLGVGAAGVVPGRWGKKAVASRGNV